MIDIIIEVYLNERKRVNSSFHCSITRMIFKAKQLDELFMNITASV